MLQGELKVTAIFTFQNNLFECCKTTPLSHWYLQQSHQRPRKREWV